MTGLRTPLTEHAGIEVPLICGAMYPCSNPELVAAVSAAGGIGIVQPLSMEYVHGHELRAGLARIRTITDRPVGMNVLIERTVRAYLRRMEQWVDLALEDGIRFFVTSLGNPRWVVECVEPVGGVVYHDVTERKWALKARDAGVHGFIAVNSRAGGHAGARSPEALLEELADLGIPVVCAGGIGNAAQFAGAIRLGYAGVQMGTRFIATLECSARAEYKQAILDAAEDDIVLTERVTGVPLAVIRTDHVRREGTRAGRMARWLLRGRRTKHFMRTVYAVRSARRLKRASLNGMSSKDYFQAGKSVGTIVGLERARDVVRQCARELLLVVGCWLLVVGCCVTNNQQPTTNNQQPSTPTTHN